MTGIKKVLVMLESEYNDSSLRISTQSEWPIAVKTDSNLSTAASYLRSLYRSIFSFRCELRLQNVIAIISICFGHAK